MDMKKDYTKLKGVLDESLEGYAKKEEPSKRSKKFSAMMAHTGSSI